MRLRLCSMWRLPKQCKRKRKTRSRTRERDPRVCAFALLLTIRPGERRVLGRLRPWESPPRDQDRAGLDVFSAPAAAASAPPPPARRRPGGRRAMRPRPLHSPGMRVLGPVAQRWIEDRPCQQACPSALSRARGAPGTAARALSNFRKITFHPPRAGATCKAALGGARLPLLGLEAARSGSLSPNLNPTHYTLNIKPQPLHPNP